MRRVFDISPDGCGGHVLRALFQANGHRVARAAPGDLAEDIAWSMATGRPPLQHWSRARLFTGLWRQAPWWRPPLEMWRAVDYLKAQFPNAVFVLTVPDMQRWLLHRLTAADGLTLRAYANHLQLDEEALPDLWVKGFQDHLDHVQSTFGDGDSLIRIDMTRQHPRALAEALHPFVRLPRRPRLFWSDGHDPLGQRIGDLAENLPADPLPMNEDFVADVADFCLKGLDPHGDRRASLSHLSAFWGGGDAVVGARGHARPLCVARLPGQDRDIALTAPDAAAKHRRAEGVINDILGLGRRDPVLIDMEDSRWVGSPQGAVQDQPTLCHNRRMGARNMVLFPLPGHYGPGYPGFDPNGSGDRIAFEDKADRLVWRGMISGSERREGIRPGPASHSFLRRLARAGDDPDARQAAWQGLCRTSRLAVVRRFWEDPDYDMRVVMAWGFRDHAADPLLAPYCDERQPAGFFHGFRYQLCMAGYDHGSNFIPAINSNSVLLKEEDGWEVFYSGRFKPWKHYIPVERYCDDLPQKLKWARENPLECMRMSENARAEVRLLSDRGLIAAVKARILDGLAQAR